MKEIISVPVGKRWVYRELLLLADPEEKAVNRYLDKGDMYVLRIDGRDVCEAVILRGENSECELMNLATAEDAQGRGYAGELVRWLMRRYSEKCGSMLVGTSEDGRGFYRRLGFQDAFVRERFFIDNYENEIIENGRQCVDMHCLRAKLRREKDMSVAYCNSAEEIRDMVARDEVYARALQKAEEKHNYWMNNFSDDVSRLSGWGHNYVCPECAGHMKMDHSNYNPGGEYVCGNCGKTGTGRHLDEAWVYYYRYDSAHDLLSSALMYHLNDDKDALDYIIRYVDFYAAHYVEFPVHGEHAGVGKITSQSLDEAVWAMAVMRALNVCGKDAFDAEKLEYWMTNLFGPLSEFIQVQANRIHNIPLWLQAAVGVIAAFYGDEKLLESALESRFGVRNQAKEGYTSDGLWYECSMGYHYYATEALSEFLAIYHLRCQEDEMFDLLSKAYTAPAELSPDGWTTPALNDGWYPTVFATYTRQIIYTHRFIPSDATGAQLRLIRERMPEKFENADALLFCQGDLRGYSLERERPDVCLFPGTCLAVMNKPTHVILKSGVLTTAHMHPDCMSISIAPFAEDIGTPGYGHPMTRTYYDQTICHNTFLMDGLSQPYRPVIGTVCEVEGGVQAHADNIFDGVSCTRTLTEKDGVLYDEMHIEADRAHQFDWVFRSAGNAHLPAGDIPAAFPGVHESYNRLSDIRRYEGAEQFEMQCELHGRKIRARICPETLKNVELYTAVMPGNPADHPLHAILLRTTANDVVIRAAYEFE